MSTIVVNKEYRDKQKRKDTLISLFIGFFALLWIFPLVWTLYSSLRPYVDLEANGVFSFPETLNLQNYFDAIRRMNLPLYFTNTAVITIPAVVLTLFLGSLMAFVVSRYSFKANVALLLFFTAGNLLPAHLYSAL
jgi:multiple sugar transport system permease protein